jgi:hypothetical protein
MPEGRDKLQRLSNIVSNSDLDRLSGRAASGLLPGWLARVRVELATTV